MYYVKYRPKTFGRKQVHIQFVFDRFQRRIDCKTDQNEFDRGDIYIYKERYLYIV